ncbi:FAD/NAD(P)-binding protein [Streptomyces asoensis]|uniref:FAD/NAD(P)-binding protein n=1 Tax=Streptomyces asoensis TaxID=249586 RepID=A0A6M4X0U5_9ACTN|nr:FAD/NAD(P)-binding protein [Streptomyces asoensis]QJT03876.1 FAD/NAD(P)-binding protein [Streptomyces asoensis]
MIEVAVRGHPYVVAVVGVGLYGLSTLERLVANIPEYVPKKDREIHIHLIDPCLDRGSRTWAVDQPSELWMNSHAGMMTLFTDDSSSCEGPVRKGPTLQEWAASAGEVLSSDETLNGLVDAFSPYRWASRSVMGKYMGWFLDHVVQNAPSNVRIHRHGKLAVEVSSASDSLQEGESVKLADDPVPLVCHRVILAQGRPATEPTPEQQELRRTMSSYGGSHEPPGQASLSKTAHIKPGDRVLLRGLGLTFFDYLQLLTTVRGGTFHRAANGSLTYEPSGNEPRIFAISRTGVLAHPVRWWPMTGSLVMCPVPRFTSPQIFSELALRCDTAVALKEATARMSSELLYFYYSDTLSADPERSSSAWHRFQQTYPSLEPGSPAQEELIASLFPMEERIDLDRMMDPLQGETFSTLESLQTWMRRHIAQITNRTLTKEHSRDLALRTALAYITASLQEASRSRGFEANPDFYKGIWDWAWAKMAILTGGAPWPRQLELQALSRCGVVTFLGKESGVAHAPEAGTVKCVSETVPVTVGIDHLIEARHSMPTVTQTSDALLRNLVQRGEISWRGFDRTSSPRAPGPQRVTVTRYGSLVTTDNRVSRTIYAVGADTSNPILTPGLPRVGTDSDVFHLTDRVARHLLESLIRGYPDTSTEE